VWTLRRQAARVVLLDRSDRVLLLEAQDPARPSKGRWWELPGGGLEAGEPTAEAAARELYEETGITGVNMGPCVWRQHATFDFGGYHFDQHEHVHVARTEGGEYRPAGLEALEAVAFKGARWWPLDELAGLIAGGGRTIPPWLLEQLSAFLARTAGAGWPSGLCDTGPIDMGELGDFG
jgi:8-oxo-dGTP pyrophosphatase MutT (NUDIX family)